MTKSNASFVAYCLIAGAALGCGSDSTNAPEAEEAAKPAASDPSAGSSATEQTASKDSRQNTGPASSKTKPSDGSANAGMPSGTEKPSDPAQGEAPDDSQPAQAVDPTQLDHTKDIRGNCKINSGYADDNACLVPPRPEEGFQIHVGPKNYDDPAEVAKFIMKPGEESSECYTIRTTNPEEIVYQTWVVSGRSGTHHTINRTYSGDIPEDVWGNCGGRSSTMQGGTMPMQTGSLPGASKPYMPRGKVAPEYEHVGMKLGANSLLQSDMHYFNFTDKDIIREYWMNLYYAPEGKVTAYADMLVGFGGTGWNDEPIPPGTDMVYKYECPFKGNGFLLNLLGHYHAHGKQFTGSIKRTNGQIDKVFEMFDYLEPAVFDYNSITQNPQFAADSAGAVSGQIPISDGDVLQWDCHIINDSDAPLAYTNEVKTGEMCNIWGYTLGTEPLRCFLP